MAHISQMMSPVLPNFKGVSYEDFAIVPTTLVISDWCSCTIIFILHSGILHSGLLTRRTRFLAVHTDAEVLLVCEICLLTTERLVCNSHVRLICKLALIPMAGALCK